MKVSLAKSSLLIISCLLILFFLFERGKKQESEKQRTILRIGTPNKVKSANIFLDSSLSIFAHLSNPPLMKMNQDGKLMGQIARKIHLSPDKTIWKFSVDENLYWSDGKKVTPEDIKFSIEYTAEKNPAAGWIKKTVDKISVTDDYAVVLKLKRPYTRLNMEFATYNILPKHIWENIKNPMRYTNPDENVGCGPFFIEKIDPNRGVIIFKKNPYWKGKQPKIDGIEIHLYQNMDVLTLALEKGEIDTYYKYASSYPYPYLKKLRSNDNFSFIEKLNIGLVFMGWNLKKKPIADLKFREALSYAINYEEIIKLDVLGYGEIPNRGFIPKSMENFKETPKLEHNINKAKKMLKKAGYKDSNGNGILEDFDGNDIKFTLLLRPFYTRIAELIRDYFRSVGIKIHIKAVDGSTWITLKDNYKYDLTISRTTPWGMLMHANWATGYFDSRRTGEGVLHIIDDPLFLTLCDNLFSTTDEQKLKDYAYKIQDYYAENLPAIPLYWSIIVTPINNKFKGWSLEPLYGIYNLDSFLNIEKVSH